MKIKIGRVLRGCGLVDPGFDQLAQTAHSPGFLVNSACTRVHLVLIIVCLDCGNHEINHRKLVVGKAHNVKDREEDCLIDAGIGDGFGDGRLTSKGYWFPIRSSHQENA